MRTAQILALFIFIMSCGQDSENQMNPPPPDAGTTPDVYVYTPPPYVPSVNPFTEDGLTPVDLCRPNTAGQWAWWCLVRGHYQSAHGSPIDLTIYRVREDICPSTIAIGALLTSYFVPPIACLQQPDSPEAAFDSGAVHLDGGFHFCHCNLLALGRGNIARQQCYAFQAENGDQEDEHTCDEATGGAYLVLTDGASTFRYDRLDPRGGP